MLAVPALLLNPLYCDHATTSLMEIKCFSRRTDRFCAWLNLNQYFCCLLLVPLIWIIDCGDSQAGADSKKSVFIYFNVFVSSLQRSWSISWCIPAAESILSVRVERWKDENFNLINQPSWIFQPTGISAPVQGSECDMEGSWHSWFSHLFLL